MLRAFQPACQTQRTRTKSRCVCVSWMRCNASRRDVSRWISAHVRCGWCGVGCLCASYVMLGAGVLFGERVSFQRAVLDSLAQRKHMEVVWAFARGHRL